MQLDPGAQKMSLGICLGQILEPDFLCFAFILREAFFLLLWVPWSSSFIISSVTSAKEKSMLMFQQNPGLTLSGSDRLDLGHGLLN